MNFHTVELHRPSAARLQLQLELEILPSSADTKSTFKLHRFFTAAKIHVELHILCKTSHYRPNSFAPALTNERLGRN